MAVYHEKEEIALELLSHSSIDLEQTLGNGATALHLAIESEKESILSALLKQGANASRLRQDGYKPFHLAIIQGWLPGVKLIANCAYVDINAQLPCGKTPIQIASENKFTEIMEFLLQRGGEPLALHFSQNSSGNINKAKSNSWSFEKVLGLSLLVAVFSAGVLMFKKFAKAP